MVPYQASLITVPPIPQAFLLPEQAARPDSAVGPAGFYYKYACIVLYSAVTAESVRAPYRLVLLYTLTVYTVTLVPPPQQK